MRIAARSVIWRYGAAALASVAAVLLTRVPQAGLLLGEAHWLLYLGAVLFAAWWGGLGPGMLATLLAITFSGFQGGLSDAQPTGQHGELVRLAIFLVEGVTVALLGEKWRRGVATERVDRERPPRHLDGQHHLFEAAVDHAPVGIAILDGQDLRIKWANPACFNFLDEPHPNELTGRRLEDIVPRAAESGLTEICRHAAQTGEPYYHEEDQFEGFARGETFWRWSLRPLEDNGDGARDLLVIAMEVTGMVQARRRMKNLARQAGDSLTQLEAVLAGMHEGLVIADLQGNVISMNPTSLRLHGFASNEECRHRLDDFPTLFEVRELAGRLLPVEEWPLARVLRGEAFSELELQVRRIDTDQYWIGNYSGTPVCNDQGEPILALVTLRDVTGQRAGECERRRLLEELEAGRARLEAMFASAPAGIVMTDEKGHILLANPAAEALTERPTPYGEEIVKISDWQFFHSDGTPYAPQDLPLARAALNGETLRDVEMLLALPNGEQRTILSNAAPIVDRQGRTTGAITIFHDLTAAKQIERERQELFRQVQGYMRELAKANATLESQRAQLRAMLQHLPVGVLIAEAPSGRIIVSNAAMDRIMGGTYELPIGFNGYDCYSLLHLDGTPYQLGENPMARTILSGEVIEDERLKIRREDGQWRTLRVGAMPLRDNFGRITAGMVAVHDITELNRLEEELRQRADELNRLNRAKDEFLAMLAHELRNPLAPILSALHIMKTRNRSNDALQRRSLEMIERQTQHMARLVDDLLDVSRITRGKIELRRETLDLTVIVRDAVESCRTLIDDQQHHLELTLPSEPVWITADPTRLEQIIANLLNNAAKYTHPGGRIWLNVASTDTEVELRVRDTGIGIPADMLTRIFDLFSQVEHSLDRAQGGLGIGLTLVRQLVELHDGRIEASSEGIGHGSEFVVHLPLTQSAAAPEIAPAAESESPDDSRLRILVVEDNTDTALAMGEVLELWGHEVRVAYDGPGAIEIAMAYQPEVILLDIGLPVMDGYQVARTLRSLPSFSSMLIIAITGYGQAEDQRRSREAGIDQHFTKPIDLVHLKELLANYVAQGRPAQGRQS